MSNACFLCIKCIWFGLAKRLDLVSVSDLNDQFTNGEFFIFFLFSYKAYMNDNLSYSEPHPLDLYVLPFHYKKAQLSLTNPRDACEMFARFT